LFEPGFRSSAGFVIHRLFFVRCRHLFIGCLDDFGNFRFQPPPACDRTKRVLAAEMGTTSETLSRTLAKFRDQNLLRVKGNAITLTKPGELKKLLERNLGEL
jgi:CRP-like cAMP-binding protein